MYYSYVMGIDNSINELKNQGFSIENDGNNFMVSFPKDKSSIWEAFIIEHLTLEYWNEYLTEDGVVFVFLCKKGLKNLKCITLRIMKCSLFVKNYVNVSLNL